MSPTPARRATLTQRNSCTFFVRGAGPMEYGLLLGRSTKAMELSAAVAQASLTWREHAAVLTILTTPADEREDAIEAFKELVNFVPMN